MASDLPTPIPGCPHVTTHKTTMHTNHGSHQGVSHVAWIAAAHLFVVRPTPLLMRAPQHTRLHLKIETSVGHALAAEAGPARAWVVALVLLTNLKCVPLPAVTRVLCRARDRSKLQHIPCR